MSFSVAVYIYLKYPRITEWLRWEETSGDHVVQALTAQSSSNHSRSRWLLTIPKDGHSTTSGQSLPELNHRYCKRSFSLCLHKISYIPICASYFLFCPWRVLRTALKMWFAHLNRRQGDVWHRVSYFRPNLTVSFVFYLNMYDAVSGDIQFQKQSC